MKPVARIILMFVVAILLVGGAFFLGFAVSRALTTNNTASAGTAVASNGTAPQTGSTPAEFQGWVWWPGQGG